MTDPAPATRVEDYESMLVRALEIAADELRKGRFAMIPNTIMAGVAEIRRLNAEVARLRAEAEAVRPVIAFGLACLDEFCNDHCDLDGGWLQDAAEVHGVIREVTMTKPCHEIHELCRCCEYHGEDVFPCKCYPVTEAVSAARSALSAKESAS